MADITLRNSKLFSTNSYIGAIICRTPKTLNRSSEDDSEYSNWCKLVSNIDDLVKYFGDPFINPQEYSDLILAYDLVSKNIPVYISSIYDMMDNDDSFSISYNGYTEFMFLDKNRHDSIGYKLKSDIKFCQPIIQSAYDGIDTLELWVHRYLLDRSKRLGFVDTISLNDSRWYDAVHYIIKLSYNKEDGSLITTDRDIIDLLSRDGFELKTVNAIYDKQALVKKFMQYSKVDISLTSYVSEYERIRKKEHTDPYLSGIADRKIEQNTYWYRINSDSYNYCLQMVTDEDGYSHLNKTALAYYEIAIDNLNEMFPKPHIACLGRLYCSSSTEDKYNYEIAGSDISESQSVTIDYLSSATTNSLQYEDSIHIYSMLLSRFDSNCDTYLFINTPDVTASTMYSKLLNEDMKLFDLSDQYNCDMYFGYVSDYVTSALKNGNFVKIYYSAAALTLYSLLVRKKQYLTNNLHGMNVANTSVKDSITSALANNLVSVRCNSIVLFDSGAPSVFGNRSLATTANLRFSHISRTFVYLRRIIREYLETQKFIINTVYNITSIINYLRFEILDQFILDSSLSNYNIEYYTENKTVYITVTLLFYGFANSITLDFSI